ncbi:cytochrome P450 [Aestuariimicrobium soli]|uniref:cytochrome P450 n=1 Tax=Aestuariimicrobium soli TaxID=2035834 RepID=UPI003EBFFA3B
MSAPSRRRASRAGEPDWDTGAGAARVVRENGIWRVRSLEAARQVLRARRQTSQAGFTAEWIPRGWFRHHPILISDGPEHDAQRSKVARFFAPSVMTERYLATMERTADHLLDEVADAESFPLDELALLFTVEVTAEVVGLTRTPTAAETARRRIRSAVFGVGDHPRAGSDHTRAMARRLTAFFRQPPFDLSKPRLGRSGRQWATAAARGLVPIVGFHLADVRPAIRQRRRRPGDDIISHLIAEGHTDADILVECVTYGTAGMVTTREFITMAAWHLLTDQALGDAYRAAEPEGRRAVLAEILRLEPVVGHLYRRVTAPFTVTDGDRAWTIPAGDLVDVAVRQANTDPRAITDDPGALCPGRSMPSGVQATGLTFGDGAHKCPGQPLALLEAEVLISRLLDRAPVVVTEPTIAEPTVEWADLIEGYVVRGLRLRLMASPGRVKSPGGTAGSSGGTP